MRFPQRLADWLEVHWVAPAYSGWILGGLALFFFAAATNTMAGWLYVISGVMLALLAIAAILPRRILKDIHLSRLPIQPVSAGEAIVVDVRLENRARQSKTLLQVQDMLPFVLSPPQQRSIEAIPANETYRWAYEQPTDQRGVYRWHTVHLRTASPLGLFWRKRTYDLNATAIVYPIVLPLTECPLIDQMGLDVNRYVYSQQYAHGATEGLTRALRPYRWGDPIRLVHWRTSARFGELRVRELEVLTGGQDIVIALDSAIAWQPEAFEQAVIAAASLYFYATRRNLQVQLWSAGSGLVHGDRPVLETLAAVQFGETLSAGDRADLPDLPLVWLSHSSAHLHDLPSGSCWILWTDAQGSAFSTTDAAAPGLWIRPDAPLQPQLQALPEEG